MKDLEDKHRKDLQRQIQATLPHLMKLRQQCITSQDPHTQVSVERFTRFLRNLQDELSLPPHPQLHRIFEPPVVTDEALVAQQKILEGLSNLHLTSTCPSCHVPISPYSRHLLGCPKVLQP